MHQEFMYRPPVLLQLSLVQSFYYTAQLREGLHLPFSGTEMDSLILQLLLYQYNKYLYQDHHHLTVLCISVLLSIKLEERLNQIILVLISMVRHAYYQCISNMQMSVLLYSCCTNQRTMCYK